jgi:Ca2+-binding EF-hand superfamily protein
MSRVASVLVLLVVGLVWVGNVSAAKDNATKKKGSGEKARQTVEEQFKKLDTNGDNYLSLEEFKAGARKGETAAVAEAVFKIKDKDGDQKLTLDEFKTKNPEEVLAKYDTNKDGEVTLEEFKAAKHGKKTAESVEEEFKKLDRNGDGKLTKEDVAKGGKHAGKAGGKGGKKKNQ